MNQYPDRKTIYIGERAVDTGLIKESTEALLDCTVEVLNTLRKNLSEFNPGVDPRSERLGVRQFMDQSLFNEDLLKRWKTDEVALVRLLVIAGVHTNPQKVWDRIIHIFPYANDLPRKVDAEKFLETTESRLRSLQSPNLQKKIGSLKFAGITFVENMMMRGAVHLNRYMLPVTSNSFSPN